MGFFIDKHNRRKSPIALAAFGAAVLELVVFGALYGLLAEPLYYAVDLGSTGATIAAHALIIAVLGTAISCLLFLLPDKRIVPYSFVGLAVALCMFYIGALLLDAASRALMQQVITLYGLAPVLVGNAAAWPVYLALKRRNPDLNRRKTVAEELREAVQKDAAKRGAPAKSAAQPAPEPAEISPEEALFGPEAGRGPSAYRSPQEEAMLLYEDPEEDRDD